jgi:hypothetical protein
VVLDPEPDDPEDGDDDQRHAKDDHRPPALRAWLTRRLDDRPAFPSQPRDLFGEGVPS